MGTHSSILTLLVTHVLPLQLRIRRERSRSLHGTHGAGSYQYRSRPEEVLGGGNQHQSRRRHVEQGQRKSHDSGKRPESHSRSQTYVFEVVEVVGSNGSLGEWRLRLICTEEGKGPVSALANIGKYVVQAMGQKVCSFKWRILRDSSFQSRFTSRRLTKRII